MPHASSKDITYLETFLEMLAAERVVAHNTSLSYKADLEKLILFLASKNLSVDKTSHKDLVEYISLLTKQNFSASSIARKISAIRQFFLFLLSENIRKDNPAELLTTPKKPKLLPRALTEQSIENLFNALDEDSSDEGVRNNAMLELLYATGMRISELVTLTIQALERDRRTNTINKSMLITGKGNKERVVLLNDTAIAKLEKYLPIRSSFLKKHKQSSSSWLFPSLTKHGTVSHISRQRFGQILKELALNQGIDPYILSPHKIRHSFATHMLQHGANIKAIQELMGHSSINSTQIYTKMCSNMALKALQKHPLAKTEIQNKKVIDDFEDDS
jgi:integrase/recombinase XerD